MILNWPTLILEIPLTEVKTEQSSKRSENIVEENKEDDYKEIDSKEIDSKEIDSKEIDSKEINSKKIDSKEIDSKKIDSKKIDAKEIDAKEINAKEIDSNEIVAKKIDANEIYAKEIDINDEINELEPMLEGEAKTEKKTKDQEWIVNPNTMYKANTLLNIAWWIKLFNCHLSYVLEGSYQMDVSNADSDTEVAIKK